MKNKFKISCSSLLPLPRYKNLFMVGLLILPVAQAHAGPEDSHVGANVEIEMDDNSSSEASANSPVAPHVAPQVRKAQQLSLRERCANRYRPVDQANDNLSMVGRFIDRHLKRPVRGIANRYDEWRDPEKYFNSKLEYYRDRAADASSEEERTQKELLSDRTQQKDYNEKIPVLLKIQGEAAQADAVKFAQANDELTKKIAASELHLRATQKLMGNFKNEITAVENIVKSLPASFEQNGITARTGGHFKNTLNRLNRWSAELLGRKKDWYEAQAHAFYTNARLAHERGDAKSEETFIKAGRQSDEKAKWARLPRSARILDAKVDSLQKDQDTAATQLANIAGNWQTQKEAVVTWTLNNINNPEYKDLSTVELVRAGYKAVPNYREVKRQKEDAQKMSARLKAQAEKHRKQLEKLESSVKMQDPKTKAIWEDFRSRAANSLEAGNRAIKAADEAVKKVDEMDDTVLINQINSDRNESSLYV